MRAITQYQADDGSKWDSRSKCLARDEMISEVVQATLFLKPVPLTCGWNGYVQHSRDSILSYKRALYKIANREGVLKYAIDMQKNDHGKTDELLITQAHSSWFERFLDGDHGPLSRAYGRLSRIDEQDREWNQPYFAMNPGTGEDICVGGE